MSAPDTPPEIVTLGCRLNTLESEMMREQLRAQGETDTVIVNTCAVTREAERQARQTIRKLRRERPNARIIVTGCAAQLDPESFAAMGEVDRVVGNAEKLDAPTLLGQHATPDNGVVVSDISELRETAGHLVSGLEGRTRAFVQIQHGCDHRCTFCIIPFARGPNRAIEPDRIIEQIAHLVNSGHKEVVLTGVDIASYGQDAPKNDALNLSALISNILQSVPALERLRLSSLDPAAIDDAFIETIANAPRFMPHLHLSLQAADDMVLKRMKRRHGRADAISAVARVRAVRPDVLFGADLIAGFPTETDEQFENTLNAVREMELAFLHVFPFSPRPGTPAAKMPQTDSAVARERASRLRELGEQLQASQLQRLIGREVSVLVEKNGMGRTEHFAPVNVSDAFDAGTLMTMQITAVKNGRLVGDVRKTGYAA